MRYSRLKRSISKQYRLFQTWTKHWRVARELWVLWEEDQFRLRGVWQTLAHCREEVEAAVETAAVFHDPNGDHPPGAAELATAHLRAVRGRYADQARIMRAILNEVEQARILWGYHSGRALQVWPALRDDLKMQLNRDLAPQPHYTITTDPFGTDITHGFDEEL